MKLADFVAGAKSAHGGILVDETSIEKAVRACPVGHYVDFDVELDDTVGIQLIAIRDALESGQFDGKPLSVTDKADFQAALREVLDAASVGMRAKLTSSCNRVDKLLNKEASTRWFRHGVKVGSTVKVADGRKNRGMTTIALSYRVDASMMETGNGAIALGRLNKAIKAASATQPAPSPETQPGAEVKPNPEA
jgi:hypothetical protein